jgi:23S rRNA A1618 N6-methylase RlmF
MCNPPFYSSPEEIARSASEKNSEPYAVSIFLSDSANSDNIHLGVYRS